jgi:formyltetrahydrofolate-dependent phosphoribosylglycinamide formyltransferase
MISGRGSNLASLAAACVDPAYPAEIALVLSNRPDAGGLSLQDGAPRAVVDHRLFGKDRAAHELAIQQVLESHDIELVCLAGYMRQLTSWLVERWTGRMMNIHPSLLPAFPGLQTHARALAAGVKLHGCTVHLVTEALDDGPIIAQAAVPVLPDDDEETLAARVLGQEHLLYPAALRLVAGQTPRWARASDALCNPLPLALGRA